MQNVHVALLRGINVGGNTLIAMADLKKIFEKAGLKNVKTLLASGNVVYTGHTDASAARVQQAVEKLIKRPIHILTRPVSELEELWKKEPFKKIAVTKDTRLYITFLGEEKKPSIKIPWSSDDGNFRILAANGREVVSVLQVTPDHGSVDLMQILEKEFGKNITTRSWNTVEKILKAAAAL